MAENQTDQVMCSDQCGRPADVLMGYETSHSGFEEWPVCGQCLLTTVFGTGFGRFIKNMGLVAVDPENPWVPDGYTAAEVYRMHGHGPWATMHGVYDPGAYAREYRKKHGLPPE